jgi:Acetyltransferase (GNAT) domain
MQHAGRECLGCFWCRGKLSDGHGFPPQELVACRAVFSRHLAKGVAIMFGSSVSDIVPTLPSCTSAGRTDLRESDELTVRIAKSSSEVEHLREIWTSLNWHPHADIDLFLLKNRLRSQVLRPHVMVVYRNGQPNGLLIGRLKQARQGFSMGGAKILLPQARILSFPYFLGIQSVESSNLLVQEIMKSLREGEADLAELTHLRLDSPLYQAVRHSPGLFCRDHFPAVVRHRTLTLPDNFQDFIASLSRKDRHALRHQTRRLLKAFPGNVRIQCFQSEDQLEEFIQDVDLIASKSYQRSLGMGFVNNLETREKLHIHARKGYLRGYVLYLAEKPCSFLIGERYGGNFYGKFMAYDPQYRRWSPGSFLLMYCIEQCFMPDGNSKIVSIDFGPGNQRYKRALFDQEWQEVCIDIFAPTLKALGINLLRSNLVLVHRLGRSALSMTKHRDEARTLWRKIVARQGTNGNHVTENDPHPLCIDTQISDLRNL